MIQTTPEETLVTKTQPRRGRKPKVVDQAKLALLLEAVRHDGGRSISYLETASGLSRAEVRAVVRALKQRGVIKQLGSKRGAVYVMA